MKEQVVELVIYKVKSECLDNFESDIIPRFRDLIKSFGGIISVQTFNALDKKDTYFDYVVWENIESAKGAIQQFEALKEKGEHADLMNWFEEVTFMDHFKLAA